MEMPNRYIKIFCNLIFLFTYVSNAYADTSHINKLILADSLFENKMFVESYELYKQLWNLGYYSERMLQKMALITEGIGDYVSTLYYLDIYHTLTGKNEVLQKMEHLATQNNLTGYEYTDLVFFLSVFEQYKSYCMFILIGIVCAYFVWIVTAKKRKRSYIHKLLLIFLWIMLYFFYSGAFSYPKAIVRTDALLMSAPSAGAHIKGKLRKGNRIRIHSFEDIWCAVYVNDRKCYVRKSNLLFTDVSKL